jgi:hypothetical protein
VIYSWIGHCQNNPDILTISEGKFYPLHSLSFQQLKHMVPYSFNPFHIDSWNTKVPKSITLDDENMRRFTRMHTIFLCNFSKYASCDSPNTPFLLSRWISILIIERYSSRISLLNFEDKKLFFFFYSRLTSFLPCKMSITGTIRKWISHSITLYKCCPIILF